MLAVDGRVISGERIICLVVDGGTFSAADDGNDSIQDNRYYGDDENLTHQPCEVAGPTGLFGGGFVWNRSGRLLFCATPATGMASIRGP